MPVNEILILLIPLLPLLGFFIHVLAGKRISEKIAGIHASFWVIVSFGISCVLFSRLSNADRLTADMGTWFSAGNLSISFGFLVDHLSIIMMLVITGIGSLIHIYSIGYMHGDEGFNRFFSYLNLFIFFMLMLVMADNYIVMFVGWEGVGLCSYLLIGFWFKNNDYTKAANKAFIMNRIGDLAMLLGLFLLFQYYGSLRFDDVFSTASAWVPDTQTITAITLLLFIGATGKSAQIPLYTWLPDAMAGPTPVSALIHAATMVTAGIYMIVRSHVLFSLAPLTMNVIMVVGIVTSLFAGTIALKQNDIKKVLAYSTVSQLGLMFFALGIGAYEAGFFHLITHAFFKALLFLAAGSVIHGLGGEQDIRNMGGIRKKMPITHAVFFIGTLAIAAVPPFAGFFSKDTILTSAFTYNPITQAHDAHDYVLWGIGLISGLITAFYMFRLYFVVFWGDIRISAEKQHHIHESPKSILIPLIVLAVLSVVGGIIDVPEFLGGGKILMHYMGGMMDITMPEMKTATEWILLIASSILIFAAIYAAYRKYQIKRAVPESDSALKGTAKVLNNKYYVDEFYDTLIVKPFKATGQFFYSVIDKFIDGIVTGSGKLLTTVSGQLRYIQNGNIGFYLFAVALGVATLILLNYFIK